MENKQQTRNTKTAQRPVSKAHAKDIRNMLTELNELKPTKMYNLQLSLEEINALMQLAQKGADELQTFIDATPKMISEPTSAKEIQDYLKGRRKLLLGIKFPEAHAAQKG